MNIKDSSGSYCIIAILTGICIAAEAAIICKYKDIHSYGLILEIVLEQRHMTYIV